jgi:hypothetical protein
LFPNRVVSFFSVLVGLHLKWRDVVPFGYILHGAIRFLDRVRGVAYTKKFEISRRKG